MYRGNVAIRAFIMMTHGCMALEFRVVNVSYGVLYIVLTSYHVVVFLLFIFYESDSTAWYDKLHACTEPEDDSALSSRNLRVVQIK
jgi:hypothetical protein